MNLTQRQFQQSNQSLHIRNITQGVFTYGLELGHFDVAISFFQQLMFGFELQELFLEGWIAGRNAPQILLSLGWIQF